MAKKLSEPTGYYLSSLEAHPKHVSAIGMISIELANLEMSLADLLAAVLQVRDEVGRAIFFAARSAALRINILDAAATSRLRPKRKDDHFHENEAGKAAALEKISSIVAAARAAVGKRHAVIHEGWGIDDETGKVHRYPLPIAEGKPAELSTLTDLIHALRVAIFHAKATALDLRKKPPTLVNMQIEQPDENPQ